jgi:hypothetical protein
MPISLKQINTLDSDTIKLDNVNYNFDQLVATGGGPRGPQGDIGQRGAQGNTGQKGFQGPTGPTGTKGFEGPISVNLWKRIAPGPISADTLIPMHTPGNQFAPVINIGYIENDPEYGTKFDLVGGKTPYQWNIHRKQYSISNLRFLNDGIAGKVYDFKLERLAGKDQMTMGFFNLDLQNSISSYTAAGTSFRSSILSPDNLLINPSGIFFKQNTEFNSPVIIKSDLVIENAGATFNGLATSSNYEGLVKFKSIREIGGTVPIGTMVSILPSIFADNTKFKYSETILSLGDTSVLPISVGKGVGSYEGWYLCNGQDWTDGVDVYTIPMLGRFNYKIADNTFSTSPIGQGSVETNKQRAHITGGSRINMNATSVSATTYNVTSTVDNDLTYIGLGTTNGTFRIKQIPQIIYLGRNDLYWFDRGEGQSTPVPLTIVLNDTKADAPKLIPDPYPLFSVTNKGAGESYTFTATVTAPLGYYWKTPIPTAADITGLISGIQITGITVASGLYPTTITISFNVTSHPANATALTLNIDTSNFILEAAVNITLNRTNSTHITCVTPESTVVSYNFYTGATFQLVYKTTPYYWIQTNNPIGGIIQPPAGGGTITILNSVLSNQGVTVTDFATAITMTVKLSGLPLTTSAGTTIPYAINVNDFSYSPLISYVSDGETEIDHTSGTGLVSKTLTVENWTGFPVEIIVHILQSKNYYSGTNAVVTGQFQSLPGSLPAFNLVVNSIANPSTSYSSHDSNRIALQDRTSVTGTFSRQPTNDSRHYVYLQYIVQTPLPGGDNLRGGMPWSGDPAIVWN